MSLLNKASLIQIPSGYKDGTLYSVKPTNGDGDFTFSRGSNLSATRVNSEGLIEKGRENLLQQSNSFSTTWGSNNVTLASGQSGYDGSSDAWLLTATGSTARLEQSVSANLNVFSIYAKAGTTDGISLRIIDGASNPFIFWNLNDGSYAGSIGGGGIDSNNQQVTNVGNGWYRIQITNASATTAMIYVSDSSANLVTSGNIYIQDAQLEQGLVATDYIETTTTTAQAGILEDMPRLDYSGGASCPSLLLEPSRTNLVDQSEYAGGWTLNGVTIQSNDITSPEGVVNGTEIFASGSISNRLNKSGFSLSGDYTFSVFLKKGTSTKSLFFDSQKGVQIDWGADGVPNVTGFSAGAPAAFDYDDYGNGWYRIWFRDNYSGTRSFQLFPDRNGGSDSVYFYGAMVEAGSYPTSYIPTYGGSSVTRSADDDCSVTSASAIIGQTEGTLLIEYDITNLESGYDWFGLSDGTINNRLILGVSDSSTQGYRLFVVSGGTTSIDTRFGDTTAGGVVKVAVRYNSGAYEVYVNGSEALTTTGVSSFAATLSEVMFDDFGTLALSIPVKQFLLFPTALTDAECIELTTL